MSSGFNDLTEDNSTIRNVLKQLSSLSEGLCCMHIFYAILISYAAMM
jgi:hypothetical protein